MGEQQQTGQRPTGCPAARPVPGAAVAIPEELDPDLGAKALVQNVLAGRDAWPGSCTSDSVTPPINDLLKQMIDQGASVLHLTAGAAPAMRVDGRLVATELDRLTPETCEELVYSLLNGSQKARFENDGEIDFSFGVRGLARLRMTACRQRGSVAAAVRLVPARHPSLIDLGLPPAVESLISSVDRGLVVVAGYSGAGRSATLASMVDWINRNRAAHILTVETAIERVHVHQRSIVNQLEAGHGEGALLGQLRRAQRQDPDVVALGELDDPDVVPVAIGLAESGRLVLAALHAPDSASVVARLLDAYPPHRQERARSQLSVCLQGVLVQSLVPHASLRGRVLACELLLASPDSRAALREGRLEDLPAAISAAREQGGQSLNENLAALVAAGHVAREAAVAASPRPEGLIRILDDAARTAAPAPAAEIERPHYNPLEDLDSNALAGVLGSVEAEPANGAPGRRPRFGTQGRDPRSESA